MSGNSGKSDRAEKGDILSSAAACCSSVGTDGFDVNFVVSDSGPNWGNPCEKIDFSDAARAAFMREDDSIPGARREH
eukprot:scaffold78453_cov52-Attheya_sp.AAC.2